MSACPDLIASAGAPQDAGPAWGSAHADSRELRQLLGSYPTGVAIVTTRAADGRPVGLTINSFASLSLDPPLVLWSLVNHSPSLDVFRDCTHFAIHVLSSEHEELARRFANPKVADKFAQLNLHYTPEGVPVLGGAVTTLVCAHDDSRHAGDHLLMVGRVVRTASTPGTPLVFHQGRFTSLNHNPISN